MPTIQVALYYHLSVKQKKTDDFLIIICNFTPVIRENYKIGVPHEGTYRELINSDLNIYWGSNVSNGEMTSISEQFHGMDNCISLNLPPLATLILKPM